MLKASVECRVHSFDSRVVVAKSLSRIEQLRIPPSFRGRVVDAWLTIILSRSSLNLDHTHAPIGLSQQLITQCLVSDSNEHLLYTVLSENAIFARCRLLCLLSYRRARACLCFCLTQTHPFLCPCAMCVAARDAPAESLGRPAGRSRPSVALAFLTPPT